jgi:hypothetical protein
VAWLLVSLAMVLSVETGIHSVHHIAHEREVAECSVAAAVNHLAGLAPDAPPAQSLLVAVATLDAASSVAAAPVQPHSIPFGRAPPSRSLI